MGCARLLANSCRWKHFWHDSLRFAIDNLILGNTLWFTWRWLINWFNSSHTLPLWFETSVVGILLMVSCDNWCPHVSRPTTAECHWGYNVSTVQSHGARHRQHSTLTAQSHTVLDTDRTVTRWHGARLRQYSHTQCSTLTAQSHGARHRQHSHTRCSTLLFVITV